MMQRLGRTGRKRSGERRALRLGTHGVLIDSHCGSTASTSTAHLDCHTLLHSIRVNFHVSVTAVSLLQPRPTCCLVFSTAMSHLLLRLCYWRVPIAGSCVCLCTAGAEVAKFRRAMAKHRHISTSLQRDLATFRVYR
jgi:hypothetical protein